MCFYRLCLKHPKITTADVEGEVISDLVLKSMYPFPRNQKCPFIASYCPFIFQKCPFISQKCLFT